MSYCGVQYDGKKCECQLQVVPGVTPATKQAANPLRICAYREYGIQYACDPGCCSTDCSSVTPTDTSSGTSDLDFNVFSSPIFIVILSILFGLMLFSAIFYKKLVKNAKFRI